MPNDEPLERESSKETKRLASDADDWGSTFVKHLDIEFSTGASHLGADAKPNDYHRLMMLAIAEVCGASGASPEAISLLVEKLTDQISRVEPDPNWTNEKNARRLALIDKLIQQEITPLESTELNRLTEQMRAAFDQEKLLPLEGARRLHRQLLDLPPSNG